MSILKTLSRNKIFYIIFIALFIIVTSFAVRQSAYTPIEVVKQHFQDEAPCFSVQRLLTQIELDKEQVLLFYYNNNNNISYALLKNSILGYKLVDAGGELAIENGVIPAGLQFGFYDKEAGWVGCGVVYDDSVAQIIIDGNNSTIVSVEDKRLWYLVGSEAIDISNTRIIDYKGNEIMH